MMWPQHVNTRQLIKIITKIKNGQSNPTDTKNVLGNLDMLDIVIHLIQNFSNHSMHMVSYACIWRWDHDMLGMVHKLFCQYRDAAMICWRVRMSPGLLCLYTEMRPLHVGNVRKANGLLCQYTEMRPWHVGSVKMVYGLMSKYRDETMTCWKRPLHSFVSIEMQQWYVEESEWYLVSYVCIQRWDHYMLGMSERPMVSYVCIQRWDHSMLGISEWPMDSDVCIQRWDHNMSEWLMVSYV